MRQWELTPEEEAEVLERYDQSTPEIRRGITLEFAMRAIEGAVLVRKFQAALDAERAKVAGLVALMEMVSADMKCYCFEDRETGEILGGLCHRCEVLAALRAAKEGPGQPDVVAKLREALRRFEDCTDSNHQFYRRVLSIAGQSGLGEGTVPT